MLKIIPIKKVNSDPSNMRKIILAMASQINQGWNIVGNFVLREPINKICIAGVGGSAIAGEILKMYLQNLQQQNSTDVQQNIAVEVIRDYTLPRTVDEHSLLFIVSYSGNTEETISLFREAIKRKCVCVCLTTGGRIQELAKMNNIPLLLLPKGLQPRLSLVVQFFMLLRILQNSGHIKDQKEHIAETVRVVSNYEKIELTALQLAQSLAGKIPLLYASSRLYGLVYRWKCQINENAKHHAFVGLLSEINHNELVGFMTKEAQFHVVFLKDDQDHPQIKKRIVIMKDLIMKRGYPTTEIGIMGVTELSKIFSGILLGDLVSYYLAVNYSLDPTPVEIIEDLKKRL